MIVAGSNNPVHDSNRVNGVPSRIFNLIWGEKLQGSLALNRVGGSGGHPPLENFEFYIQRDAMVVAIFNWMKD